MMMTIRNISRNIAFAAVLFVSAAAAAANLGSSPHYATDAYPGFDSEAGILATPKKTPGWFPWSGPKMLTPADQLAWAGECEARESWGAARRGYDALVAEWPAAPEAAKAQEALAELEYARGDYIQALAEFKYLLDFYSTQCDYDAVMRRLYDTAKRMRETGKRIVFFRFANTTDVRRAFEAVVRRAPGAPYAAEAMFAVAELREEEGEPEKAIQVYENLRNLHPDAPEAKAALFREARARMEVLRAHSYNKARCQDTIDYLKMALATNPAAAERSVYESFLREATAQIEAEDLLSTRFYDSVTRTRRSAIASYKKFLHDYPLSDAAPEVQARLRELEKEEAK